MEPRGTTRPPIAAAATVRPILVSGLVLGLALALGLAYWLFKDHQLRMQAAQRQSLALSTGTERLLSFELRNLERAMRGIAADARQLFQRVPQQAPALLTEAVAGVVDRHAEIESIVLLDAQGEALTAGRSEPQLPRWIAPQYHVAGSAMYIGPPQRNGQGWLLPLMVPLSGSEQWILTRLHLDELQRIVSGLDTGTDGVVTLLDRTGTVLARSRTPEDFVGRHFPVPGSGSGRVPAVSGRYVSDVDGTPRILSVAAPRNYPLVVVSGLSLREVLLPWQLALVAVAVVYAWYWLGFLYLLQALRRGQRGQVRLLAEVRRGNADLRLAQQAGKVGAWTVHEHQRELLWGADVQRIFDIEAHAGASPLSDLRRRIDPRDLPRLAYKFRRAWRQGKSFTAEFRIIDANGRARWLGGRGGVVREGGQRRMTGTLIDITERVQTQSRLLDAERQFRLIFDRNPLPFWVYDIATLRFLEVNHAATRQYGYSREEFLRMTLLDIRDPEQHEKLLREVRRRPAGEAYKAPHAWIHRRKDGTTLQVQVHSSDITFSGHEARLVLAEDIDNRVAYENELSWRAEHELITGLLNVQTLTDRLDALGHGARYEVAYLQLRGLQPVRDSLGRRAAEDVIRVVAGRLWQWAERQGALLAHQPAQDFVLAMLGPAPREDALESLLALLREPVRGHGSVHALGAYIGVAEGDGSGRAEQAIDNAALAAHAIDDQQTRISRYDGGLAQRYGDRLRLAGRLREAIERGEFELHYQPIVSLARRRTVLLEALLRWPQADGSHMPPAEFVPLCEDTGLIVPLGDWIIQQAAQAQRQLAEQGWPELAVAVNVSPLQVLAGGLAARIEAACRQHGLAPGALHVELTESVLLEHPERAMQTMRRLHELGVRVSLDDFGTGFSSLSYLRHLPLDSLKIDRSFLTDVTADTRDAAICRAILMLGKSLGLSVIAEGVETGEQLAWLQRNGCDHAQGFLIGQPLPLQQAMARLQAQGEGVSAA